MFAWRASNPDRARFKRIDKYLKANAGTLPSVDVPRLRQAFRDAEVAGRTLDELDLGISALEKGRLDAGALMVFHLNPELLHARPNVFFGWADFWGQTDFDRGVHSLAVLTQSTFFSWKSCSVEEFVAMAEAGVEPEYLGALYHAGIRDYWEIARLCAAGTPVEYAAAAR